MKVRPIYLRMFGLLMMLSCLFIACDDDGDDISFLEKHGESLWKISEGGGTVYAQINNSVSNPLELWASLFDACYIYESISGAGNVEVLENTENKLVLRIDEGTNDYAILSLTVIGEILTVKSDYYEDGSLDESETIALKSSSDDVNELELCEL